MKSNQQSFQNSQITINMNKVNYKPKYDDCCHGSGRMENLVQPSPTNSKHFKFAQRNFSDDSFHNLLPIPNISSLVSLGFSDDSFHNLLPIPNISLSLFWLLEITIWLTCGPQVVRGGVTIWICVSTGNLFLSILSFFGLLGLSPAQMVWR